MNRIQRWTRSFYAGFIFTGLQASVDLLTRRFLQPLYPSWNWQGNLAHFWLESVPSFIIFVILVDLLLERQSRMTRG